MYIHLHCLYIRYLHLYCLHIYIYIKIHEEALKAISKVYSERFMTWYNYWKGWILKTANHRQSSWRMQSYLSDSSELENRKKPVILNPLGQRDIKRVHRPEITVTAHKLHRQKNAIWHENAPNAGHLIHLVHKFEHPELCIVLLHLLWGLWHQAMFYSKPFKVIISLRKSHSTLKNRWQK